MTVNEIVSFKKKIKAGFGVRIDVLLVAVTFASFMFATGTYFLWIYKLLEHISGTTSDYYSEVYAYLAHAIGLLLITALIKYKRKLLESSFFFPLILFVVTLLSIFLAHSDSYVVIAVLGLIESVFVGMILGTHFYLLSSRLDPQKSCLLFGISYAIATVATGVVSLIDRGKFVASPASNILYAILAVMTAAFWIAIKKIEHQVGKAADSVNDSSGQSTLSHVSINRSTVIMCAVMILLMWSVQSIGFYFPIDIALDSYINPEILRIPYAIGLIVAGYINMRSKKVGSILCLICLAYPFFAILFADQKEVSVLLYSITHIFIGFYTLFRFGLFAHFSKFMDQNGKKLICVCCYGIFFGRLGEAIGSFIGLKFSGNPLLLMALEALAFVMTILLFVLSYIKLFTPVPEVVKSHDEIIGALKTDYDLSRRETDVLNLLLDGLTNSDIADNLYVSENTVRFHVSNILKKTSCSSRNEVMKLFEQYRTNEKNNL